MQHGDHPLKEERVTALGRKPTISLLAENQLSGGDGVIIAKGSLEGCIGPSGRRWQPEHFTILGDAKRLRLRLDLLKQTGSVKHLEIINRSL